MIPVKKITITRGEGPTALCGKPHEFTSFEHARGWLYSWSETFPRNGGYDKHDFKVEFEDGEIYEGRLDCKHSSCKNNDLDIKEHILHFCRWMAGRAINPWCGEEKYRREIESQDQKITKEYADFLDKYMEEKP